MERNCFAALCMAQASTERLDMFKSRLCSFVPALGMGLGFAGSALATSTGTDPGFAMTDIMTNTVTSTAGKAILIGGLSVIFGWKLIVALVKSLGRKVPGVAK